MTKLERANSREVNDVADTAAARALRGVGLTKVYGGRAVVDNVNVFVKPGEVVVTDGQFRLSPGAKVLVRTGPPKKQP